MNHGALSLGELADLVTAVAADPARWHEQIRFDVHRRWWTRLHSDGVADVWLLTWVRDTGTDLHDHGDSSGAFTVVSGEIEEVRSAADGRLTRTVVRTGEVHTVERGAVHDVRSPSRWPAISIHAYSPPLREMTFYAAATTGPEPTRTVAASPVPRRRAGAA